MGFWWWGYAKMMEIVQEAIELPLKYKKSVGITDIITSSQTYEDMANMSITVTTGANPVLILAQMPLWTSYTGFIRLLIDDVEKCYLNVGELTGSTSGEHANIVWLEALSAGSHTFKLQWHAYTAVGWVEQRGETESPRILVVIELVDAEESS